jgi:type II secretory pathway predicted ATPase ExeA
VPRLFADDAVAGVHRHSLGLPRALNNAAVAAVAAAISAAMMIAQESSR